MNMDIIAQYGPVAIAFGAFVEGETAVLLGGAGLALGLFDFWTVVLAAFAGSVAGDQFFFWLGRCKGTAYLAPHPRFKARTDRAGELILRHRVLLLVTYRFIYGLRGAIPFTLGLSNLCWRYFLLANLLTAGVWSVFFTLAGLHAASSLSDPALAARLPLFGAGAALLFLLGLAVRRHLKSRT